MGLLVWWLFQFRSLVHNFFVTFWRNDERDDHCNKSDHILINLIWSLEYWHPKCAVDLNILNISNIFVFLMLVLLRRISFLDTLFAPLSFQLKLRICLLLRELRIGKWCDQNGDKVSKCNKSYYICLWAGTLDQIIEYQTFTCSVTKSLLIKWSDSRTI